MRDRSEFEPVKFLNRTPSALSSRWSGTQRESPNGESWRFLPGSRRLVRWLDSDAVVQGIPDLLLATKVSFGRLNRDVPEEELNLFEFTAGHVAEPGAGAA